MEDRDPIEEEQEEQPKAPIFPGGLTAFFRNMQERDAPLRERGWRQQWRRRSGLGGRGYTKSARSEKKEKKEKIRRKIAKKNQKINRRTKTTKSQKVIRRHRRKKK